MGAVVYWEYQLEVGTHRSGLELETDEDHPHDLNGCRGPRLHRNQSICVSIGAGQSHIHKTMFRKRRLVNSEAGGSNADPNQCEWVQRLSSSQLCLSFLAKGQRVVDGAKILLDVAKESSDWFPPLKSALGGVSALINHYEVLVGLVVVTHN